MAGRTPISDVAPPPRPRLSRAFKLGAGVLVVAFVADTGSTLAHGPEALARDVNPLLRRLDTGSYLGWSLLRLAIALALLGLCWPGPTREGRTLLRRLLALLLLALGPFKLAAAGSNLWLLAIGSPLGPPLTVLTPGLLAGLVFGGLVLRWDAGLGRRAGAAAPSGTGLPTPPSTG